jgi:iron complex outermembrane receptor protein
MGLILGRGVRSPDMSERYIILLPVGYDPYDYLGNPQLKPEANNEADLKVEYKNGSIGHFNFVTFFSYVQDYILGRYVPPSEVKPQTPGVLGVKEFYNEDYVFLYGFEFAYMSPDRFDWSLNGNIAYTAGINPGATALVVEDGQVVGEEIISNDPLPEIPPLEGNVSLGYRFFDNKLIPELRARFVASQNKISSSYDEKSTPGFITAGFKLSYHFNEYLDVHGGVNNIFNKAYYEHLNRRIIGTKQNLYEPGRVFYINLVFNI